MQSKNRAEQYTAHFGNMYNGITSVPFYDTLGAEATAFIMNQTQITTFLCSIEYVEKIATMKIEDSTSPQMGSLKNIVSFEKVED